MHAVVVYESMFGNTHVIADHVAAGLGAAPGVDVTVMSVHDAVPEVITSADLPQVLPNFIAYGLYVFELNIRASVVIGFVGSGVIGRLLDERRQLFQCDQVMAIVLVIFVSVLIIYAFSIYYRKRIS